MTTTKTKLAQLRKEYSRATPHASAWQDDTELVKRLYAESGGTFPIKGNSHLVDRREQILHFFATQLTLSTETARELISELAEIEATLGIS